MQNGSWEPLRGPLDTGKNTTGSASPPPRPAQPIAQPITAEGGSGRVFSAHQERRGLPPPNKTSGG